MSGYLGGDMVVFNRSEIIDKWSEQDTGYSHVVEVDKETGMKRECISDSNGNLLAGWTMNTTPRRATIIEWDKSTNQWLGSKTYSLGRGFVFPTGTTYANLIKHIEGGAAILLSRSEPYPK